MRKTGAKKSTEYAAMVAEAEASVSAVRDPELRRVAFEKILGAAASGFEVHPVHAGVPVEDEHQ